MIVERLKRLAAAEATADDWMRLLDDGTFFSKSVLKFVNLKVEEVDETTLEFEVDVKCDIGQADLEAMLVDVYGDGVLNDRVQRREIMQSMNDHCEQIKNELLGDDDLIKDELVKELRKNGYKKVFKVDDLELRMGINVIGLRNISMGKNIKGRAYLTKNYA